MLQIKMCKNETGNRGKEEIKFYINRFEQNFSINLLKKKKNFNPLKQKRNELYPSLWNPYKIFS